MKKILKLYEFSSNPWSERWKVLEVFLASHDVTLQVQTVAVQSYEQISEELKKIKPLSSETTLGLIDDLFSDHFELQLPQVTRESQFLASSDFLVFENEKWWPRSVADEALIRCISQNAGRVDLNSASLVVGCSGLTRAVVYALAKLGFSKINLADPDEKKAQQYAEDFKKKLFNIEFKFVPRGGLTLLPGSYSMLINTSPLSLDNEILEELYFFNFLKVGGIVMDTTLIPAQTPLMMEAQQWGASLLSGDLVATERDCVLAERYAGVKLDRPSYRKDLREKIDGIPFDPTPFLERFRSRSV